MTICDKCGSQTNVNYTGYAVRQMFGSGDDGIQSYADLCPNCRKALIKLIEDWVKEGNETAD